MGQEYPLGEYIDFQFNGKWASSFNLVRICQGNRNSDKLIPTLKDRTVDIPGRDGQYYFGSNYDKRQFTFDFAFDSLTREQIEEVKAWLGDKKIEDLVLSEDTYTESNPILKTYKAKVTSQSILKYIPFDNVPNAEGGDLYKGEGSVQFTCYYPFAKQLDIEKKAKVSDINSFIEETSIVVNSYIEYTSSEDINSGITLTGTEVMNASKAPAPWTFRIGLSNDTEEDPQKTLTLMINSTEYVLDLEKEADFRSGSGGDYVFISYESNNPPDTYLELNSRNNSIIFCKKGKIQYLKSRNNSSIKMPKLYNRILTSTTELKPIPIGNFLLDLKSNNNEITGLFTYTPIVY